MHGSTTKRALHGRSCGSPTTNSQWLHQSYINIFKTQSCSASNTRGEERQWHSRTINLRERFDSTRESIKGVTIAGPCSDVRTKKKIESETYRSPSSSTTEFTCVYGDVHGILPLSLKIKLGTFGGSYLTLHEDSLSFVGIDGKLKSQIFIPGRAIPKCILIRATV